MTTSRLKGLIFIVEYTQYEATLHHIDADTLKDNIDYNQLHNITGNFCLRYTSNPAWVPGCQKLQMTA